MKNKQTLKCLVCISLIILTLSFAACESNITPSPTASNSPSVGTSPSASNTPSGSTSPSVSPTPSPDITLSQAKTVTGNGEISVEHLNLTENEGIENTEFCGTMKFKGIISSGDFYINMPNAEIVLEDNSEILGKLSVTAAKSFLLNKAVLNGELLFYGDTLCSDNSDIAAVTLSGDTSFNISLKNTRLANPITIPKNYLIHKIELSGVKNSDGNSLEIVNNNEGCEITICDNSRVNITNSAGKNKLLNLPVCVTVNDEQSVVTMTNKAQAELRIDPREGNKDNVCLYLAGGTARVITDGAKVADKITVLQGTGIYAVKEHKITSADELNTAFTAIGNGDIVCLKNDITLTQKIMLNKEIELNLNGNTLYADKELSGDDAEFFPITVYGGGTLTVKDCPKAICGGKIVSDCFGGIAVYGEISPNGKNNKASYLYLNGDKVSGKCLSKIHCANGGEVRVSFE